MTTSRTRKISPASKTPRNRGKKGEHRKILRTQLTVVRKIQRTRPNEKHLADMKRNWDRDKVGILLVAHLTDGDHAGEYHICDGATRWEAATTADPKYVFDCWVEDMTEQEAATRFLSVNRDSKAPGKFDLFKVGLVTNEPDWLALKAALDRHNVIGDPSNSSYSGYGNGDPGRITAIAAVHRIVLAGYKQTGDWGKATDRLDQALGLARECYHDATAHDADLIQALDRILIWNPTITDKQRKALVAEIQILPVAAWRKKAMESRNVTIFTYGGSQSRALHMARVILTNFNRRKRGAGRLKFPD